MFVSLDCSVFFFLVLVRVVSNKIYEYIWDDVVRQTAFEKWERESQSVGKAREESCEKRSFLCWYQCKLIDRSIDTTWMTWRRWWQNMNRKSASRPLDNFWSPGSIRRSFSRRRRPLTCYLLLIGNRWQMDDLPFFPFSEWERVTVSARERKVSLTVMMPWRLPTKAFPSLPPWENTVSYTRILHQ